MASNVLRVHPVRSLVVVLVCLTFAVASVRVVVADKSSTSVDKSKVPVAGGGEPEYVARDGLRPEGVQPEGVESKDLGTGFQGICYEELEFGGPKIEGVRIVFVSEDGKLSRSAVSQKGGWYRINLAPGRYQVTADSEGFQPYSTERGFFVAGGSEYRTGNFFLKRSGAAATVVGVAKGASAKERLGQSETGYRGGCYERLENGVIGPRIEGVQIVFVSEDGSLSINATSQAGGFYQVSLPPGRYRGTAGREGFEPYSTEQGFFVAGGSEYRTGNVFLKRSGGGL